MRRKRYERNRRFTGEVSSKDKLYTSRREIKKLVKKALKDKPKHEPAKGYVFLSSLNEGDRFTTGSGTKGILIEKGINCHVIITDVKAKDEDRAYYMGKQIFPELTEVKKLKE